MGGVKIDLAQDFRDLLRAFVDHEVRFLVVGAYALAILGRPRATGDLDVWRVSNSRPRRISSSAPTLWDRHLPRLDQEPNLEQRSRPREESA